MTDQLVLAVVALLGLLVLLIIVFEAEETWRWRGSENRPPSRFRIVRFIRRAVGGLFAIVTLGRSSGRHTSRSEPAPMASEDVTRRLGYGDGPVHIAPQRIVVSGSHPVDLVPLSPAVVVAPPLAVERTSRLRLIRDTVGATLVLAGFVVVAVNVVIPPSQSPQPSGEVRAAVASAPATPSPAPTEAPSASPVTLATEEPIASGTGLVSAEPTPTPTPTAHPTRQRTPQPTTQPLAPTDAPTATPKPTPKPTHKPTPKPTPVPAPVVALFTFSVDVCTATFTNTSQGADTYLWEFGDGATSTATSPVYTFPGNGDWSVTLTAANTAGKTDPQTQTVRVDVCP